MFQLSIFSEVVEAYRRHITDLEEDVKLIIREEKEERQMRACENQTNKAQRLLENAGRDAEPKRQWFQTHRQRMEEKGKSLHRLGLLSVEYCAIPSSETFAPPLVC